jgi:hypothetical protein
MQTAIALFIGLSASLFLIRTLMTGVASADWRSEDDATIAGGAFYSLLT